MSSLHGLPPSLLRSRFPAFGSGNNPRLESDGTHLIIRNVEVEGNYYDVRIQWRSPDGNVIYLNENTGFMKSTIQRVQEIVKELFTENYSASPQGTKIHFSDVGESAQCVQEILSDPSLRNEDRFHKIESSHAAFDLAKECHELFLSGTTVTQAWSSSPDRKLILYPKMIKKEEPSAPRPADAERNGTQSPDLPTRSVNGENQSSEKEIPSHIEKGKILPSSSKPKKGSAPLPDPLSSKPSSPSSSPEKNYRALTKALDHASKTFPNGASFFGGITFSDLQKYSMSPNKDGNPQLKKAYQAFCNVLKYPKSDFSRDVESSDMKKWIEHHYFAVYEEYGNLKHLYDREFDESDSFEDWKKTYAAQLVAGFIFVPDSETKALVNSLKALPIIDKGNKRGWGRFYPFFV